MKITITGGAGFLGLKLARALLASGLNGRRVEQLILADRVAVTDLDDHRVQCHVGDIADPGFIDQILAMNPHVVYHLAAVVSGQAEADFDLGLRVNVDASRLLLDACRRAGNRPRVVFTSSIAVFGPSGPNAIIDDRTPVDPQSSYGVEKAIGELLVKEYSRRGFIDGIVLRLPTICVRPGRPNKAASSFASGIIREPLSGLRAACPVSPGLALWLLSPRYAVEALITAAAMDGGRLGNDRVVNLPGLSVTVAEMLQTLEDVGGPDIRGLVYEEPDAAVERIVASWPRAFDDRRARALGFRGDPDFRSIVDAFVADER